MALAAVKQDTQSEIDQKNREYWDSLCGSHLAQVLGITDFSRAALEKFDAYFFGFYPYVFKRIPLEELWKKKILEIGLGYGSVAQMLAAVASDYTGLDIAQGPVDLVNERMHLVGFEDHARAVQGSILEPPLPPESFDAVVTIGCLHHTGNLPVAIEQIERLLKPGGEFHFMLYNAYSYRRWALHPAQTLKHLWADLRGKHPHYDISEKERSEYDADAPETVFTSSRQVKRMLRKSGFKKIRVARENAAQEGRIMRQFSRRWLCAWVAPWAGLDLYISAHKPLSA